MLASDQWRRRRRLFGPVVIDTHQLYLHGQLMLFVAINDNYAGGDEAFIVDYHSIGLARHALQVISPGIIL